MRLSVWDFDTTPIGPRVVDVLFHTELLGSIIRNGNHIHSEVIDESGVPDDAEVVGCWVEQDTVRLRFTHPSFRSLAYNERVPELMPHIRTLTCTHESATPGVGS